MRMRKNLLLMFLAAFVIQTAWADDISLEQAISIAQQFVSHDARAKSIGRTNGKSVEPRLAHAVKSKTSQKDNVYVINLGDDQGFVIVAGDDGADAEVLGYCDHGTFEYDKTPIQVKELLEHYSTEIDALSNASVRQRQTVSPKSAAQDGIGNIVVAPLIKTQWNQTHPYNLMMPEGYHVTGCTNTAMAQIMKYWEWPKQGRGTYANIQAPDNYKQLIAEKRWEELAKGKKVSEVNYAESKYDWANMHDTYMGDITDTQRNAVAKLMYDCFNAANTVAMAGGGMSGGYPDVLLRNSVRHLYYSPNWQSHVGYGDSIIMKELDEGRPVFYCGYPKKGYGHALVCDGYSDAGYLHFNFGWGGTADGYYLSSALTNGSWNFSYNVCFYTGIQPSKTAFEVEGVCYDLLDNERACVTACIGQDPRIKDYVEYEGKKYRVTKIMPQAFYDTDIQSLYLPATLDSIGYSAFMFCSKLETIDIASLDMWLKLHFEDETANPLFCGSANKEMLLNGVEMTDIVIPGDIKEIPPHMFEGVTTLRNVEISSGIMRIGEYAFSGCNNLQKVTLPPHGIVIENDVFRCGINLSHLTEVSNLNSAYKIGDRAFANCPMTDVSVLNWVFPITIGNDAFSSHKAKWIDIPEKLVKIGLRAYASKELYGYRDVADGKNPSYSVHNEALYNKDGSRLLHCPPMQEYSNGYGGRYSFGVRKGTRTITTNAFILCNLQEIIIPESVTEIEPLAFAYLEELRDVYNYATTPQPLEPDAFSKWIFEYSYRKAKLHVRKGCAEAYASAPGWNQFELIVEDQAADATPEPGYDGEANYNGFLLTYYDENDEWQEMTCLLSDNPVFTTDDTGLVITTDKLKMNLEWNSNRTAPYELKFIEVAEMTDVQQITIQKGIKLRVDGFNIHVEGLKAGTEIQLYSVEGKLAGKTKASNWGAADLRLPTDNKSTYVLKAGKQSVKFQKL